MQRLILVYLMSLLLLSGCITTEAPTQAPNSRQPTQREAKPLNPVQDLLDQAERAFNAKRLTTPVDDNAYLRYVQVLSIQPNNQEAHLGLQRIVDTYLAWSIKAIESGQYRRATSMLNKARSIDEQHPSIDALEQRISKAKRSTHDTYRLDPKALSIRDQTLIGQLHELGRSAESNNARVRIIAGSDADGRWIYQQLNDASINRVRATIELGRPAQVQIIYN